MTMADQKVRDAFTEHLKTLVATNHPDIPVAFIGGSYSENYSKAIALIDEIYPQW